MSQNELRLSLGIALVAAALTLGVGLPALALVGALAGTLLAFRYPPLLLPAVVAGIMLSNFQLIPSIVVVVPLTLGKITTLGAMAIGGVHAWYFRRPALHWTSLTPGFLLAGLALLLSLVPSGGDIGSATPTFVGFFSLALLTHLIVVWVPRDKLDDSLLITAVVLAAIMAYSVIATGRLESGFHERGSGVYDSPNLWCAILVALVPVVVGAVQNRGVLGTLLTGLLLFLYPLNVALSMSRGGALSASIGALFLLYTVRRQARYALPLLALALVTVPALVDIEALSTRYSTLYDEELGESDGSLANRAAAIRTGALLFRENPLLGVGAGRFQYEALDHSGGLIDMVPHNSYSAIASQTGLVGLFAAGVLGALVLRLLWHGWRRSRHEPDQRDAIAGCIASVVGMLVMGVSADLTTFPVVYVCLGVMLVRVGPIALAQSSTKRRRRAAVPSEEPVLRAL